MIAAESSSRKNPKLEILKSFKVSSHLRIQYWKLQNHPAGCSGRHLKNPADRIQEPAGLLLRRRKDNPRILWKMATCWARTSRQVPAITSQQRQIQVILSEIRCRNIAESVNKPRCPLSYDLVFPISHCVFSFLFSSQIRTNLVSDFILNLLSCFEVHNATSF